MYLPGDTVLITDIGIFVQAVDPVDPGLSLVCFTTNVNTACCRSSDGESDGISGNVGDWYFPDGMTVPRFGAAPSADFSRSGYTQQVRLNRRNNSMTPTGAFECRVPDTSGVEQIASIILSTGECRHVLSYCKTFFSSSSCHSVSSHHTECGGK